MKRPDRALVTGASSGIGEEFARQLAARGCALVLVARRRQRLEELAAELRARCGVDVEVLAADLGGDGLGEVERRLTDSHRPIDLLVNNAGRGGDGRVLESSADTQQHIAELNMIAPMRLARVAAGEMAARGTGGVINVASLAGMLPASPGMSVYAATKAFLASFSQSLDAEVRRHGVRVTVVCPGYVPTEMTRGLQERGMPSVAWVSKRTVARSALRALAAGRPFVVPGAQYKAADVVVRMLPRGLVRWVIGRAM